MTEVPDHIPTTGATLSEQEIIDASGGYRQPSAQLRELHRRGFWRAYRSTLTGKVVLERPHYDAVSRGVDAAPSVPGTPKLRKPVKKNAVPA